MSWDLVESLRGPEGYRLVLSLGGGDRRRGEEIARLMAAFFANKPPTTRRTYGYGVRYFLDLVQWKDIRTISLADAVLYKRYLMEPERKYSNSTICTYLAAIDSFLAFLTRPVGDNAAQVIPRNPFDFIDRKDVSPTAWAKSHSDAVAQDDLKRMLDALPTDPVGMRDRAVLVFLAKTGRRRSEVAGLRVGNLINVNVEGVRPSYRCKVKGGKDKEFELPAEAYEAMRVHWISSGRLDRLRPESAVFGEAAPCALSVGLDLERPLHHTVIWKIVKNAASRAGLDPTKIKVHGLRHMAARTLNRGGARLQDIQQFLGHEHPNTTGRYLGKLEGPAPALTEYMERGREAETTGRDG